MERPKRTLDLSDATAYPDGFYVLRLDPRGYDLWRFDTETGAIWDGVDEVMQAYPGIAEDLRRLGERADEEDRRDALIFGDEPD